AWVLDVMKPLPWLGVALLASISAWPLSASAGMLADASRHSSTDYCSRDNRRSAAEQDRHLRLAQAALDALVAHGGGVAIVSRSGLDLRRIGQRYSHGGVAVRSANTWAVRQLYFDCEERRPRLFDQGLAGFVMGNDNPDTGFISLLLLPEGAAREQLLAQATNDRAATALIAGSYSANAYAHSLQHQNCNQWLAELLGIAWGAALSHAGELPNRADAQAGLQRLGYTAERLQIEPGWLLGLLRGLPYLNLDDHPPADVAAGRLQVSMPASVERLVQQWVPGTERVELCHNRQQIVVRRGGRPLPDDCSASPGDTTLPLD
ncbi:MAG: DUF2145 domain-containing protein, partial [Rubrivivax sp.]|nr:DUF2145 domain-containing protein [Rubrivivax sp.]